MKDEKTRGGTATTAGSTHGSIGLYFCRCGPNLGNVVRLGDLADAAAWPGVADVAEHAVLCAPEGRAWLTARIRERGLERAVVAACSPREHEETFRTVMAEAGASPWHVQLVNLREQVEWTSADPGAATGRARRLVTAALRRVALHRSIPREEVDVSPDVLVLGGGPAGISAALALAGRERKVLLVERDFVLGGHANRLDAIFPDLECASCFMEPALDRALHSDRIEVLTGAQLRRVRGAQGRFEVEIAVRPRGVDPAVCLGCGSCAAACPADAADPWNALARRKAIGLPYPGCLPHVSVLDASACRRSSGDPCDACARACALGAIRLDDAGTTRRATIGAIVIATGLAPGPVRGPDGVVSSFDLERMLHPDGPTGGAVRGAGGREPAAVLLATTAEEEDGDLAAEEILKLAAALRERLPRATIAVAGGFDRVPRLARRAADLARKGVELLPEALVPDSVVSHGDGALEVRLAAATGERVRAADLVVLHAPSVAADGTDAVARLLRLATGPRGFLVDRGASPFEPTATRIAGIYVAGAAAGPRPIPQAIRDGAAAAGLVVATLAAGERRAIEPLAAEVDEARCGGCGVCVSVCPFGGVELRVRDESPASGRFVARVEAVHCRGCGSCVAACPTGAASARHFTREQIAAEISALLGGS